MCQSPSGNPESCSLICKPQICPKLSCKFVLPSRCLGSHCAGQPWMPQECSQPVVEAARARERAGDPVLVLKGRVRVGARPGRLSHRITPEPWPLLVSSADGVRPLTGLEQLSPSRGPRIPWPMQPTPTAQHPRLGIHPGHCHMVEDCGRFTTAVLLLRWAFKLSLLLSPSQPHLALSFP